MAARQFGVVTYGQLLDGGLSRTQVEHRVASGQLQRLWRGVYAFGHRELTREGHLIAAVFACGPAAAISERSAAACWEILAVSRALIDVTVPGRGSRTKRPGIDLHSVRRLDADDVTQWKGIPITTVPRTLLDLSSTLPERLVERAMEQAYIRRLLTPEALDQALQRSNGRRTRALRHLIAMERRTSTVTRSELEERFLGLIRRAGLPEPEVNARLAGYEVDFLWRDRRRVVEVDGFAYHSTRRRRAATAARTTIWRGRGTASRASPPTRSSTTRPTRSRAQGASC